MMGQWLSQKDGRGGKKEEKNRKKGKNIGMGENRRGRVVVQEREGEKVRAWEKETEGERAMGGEEGKEQWGMGFCFFFFFITWNRR